MWNWFKCLGLASSVVLAGCGTERGGGTPPSPSMPAGSTHIAVTSASPLSAATVRTVASDEPTGVLTLRQALALALVRSPELASSAWEIRAAEARTLQAGLIPAPEVGMELNEFGGRGARRGFEGMETTLQLSQLVELGGKRGRRMRVAELERDLAAWDYESARLEVLLETTRAFVAVLAAQRQVALAEDGVALARQVVSAVSGRVRAGVASPLEETRAEVALSTRRLALERAQRNLRTAREALAASWGSTAPSFVRAEGDLEAVREVPALPRLVAGSGANPDLARWAAELQQREAALALERAKTVPDPTITAGVTRFEETDDSALLLGLSIPLPIFGLNPGGVREASANLTKAVQQRRAAEVRVATALAQAHQTLASSHAEITALKRSILPAAERAFEVARQGYEGGKFGFLEVLDAQRTLLEARGSYIEALSAYHTALAEVERLTGKPVDGVAAPNGRTGGEPK